MDPFVDSEYLRSAGRALKVPFHLHLRCNGRLTELVCTRVMRVLPGKRLVCLGEWNDHQVVAKIFLESSCAKRHCAREENGVRALREASIKTPDLLFKGLLVPDSTPVLGFRRIIPVQEFAEVWRQASSVEQRGEYLCRTAAIIADQHEAGLKQDDPHPGNFLLAGDDIYTIDGDAVESGRMGKPLSEAKSLRNLGLFFAQFYPQFEHLIPSALQEYAEKRLWSAGPGLYLRLMKEVRSQGDRRKKDYLKKIYRESSPFVRRKSWNSFMVCDREFYNEEMIRFLSDPDQVIDESRLLKKGNTSTVALVGIRGKRMVVKRYNIKSTRHGLGRCFRRSRAWITWRNSHRLVFLGIPTAKPIAFLEKRWGPFRSKAYFVMEYVDGVDLHHLFHSGMAKEIDKEDLAKQFGGLFQLLANASISHGDCKATNFIAANGGLAIIDLDAMREHRLGWRSRRAFRRDLERLMQNWEDLPEVENIFREELKNFFLDQKQS